MHIFCSRTSDDRADTSNEGNEQEQEKEAKERREKFFSALPLLAYDGPECIEFHNWLYDTLSTQLGKCEACIRQYYLEKVPFEQQLNQDYEENEVKQFLGIIARRDVVRIRTGLDAAKGRLIPLPAERRGPKVLDNKQLFAFYETLHCDAFFNDEQSLQNHFDIPFELVQTHRQLKIKEILPATTSFLFSTNQYRMNWAVKTWRNLGRPATNEEWDWAVKGIVTDQLNKIRDEAGLIRFWGALRVICGVLTKEQVELKLFDLGFNFARLSLDHLAKPTLAVPHIASSLQIVWTKAPGAYWQNLTSVSAATVAEQFFASPKFDACLETYAAAPNSGNSDVLSWIQPFLKALPAANRPSAARTLTHQLFNRVKSSKLSDEVKQVCFEQAVAVLVTTVLGFSNDQQARDAAARPVLSDVLTLTSTHLPSILSFEIKGTEEHKADGQEKIASLVKNSLALECMIFKADYEALHRGEPKAQCSSHTPDLWRTVNRHLHADRPDLSRALLIGIMTLVGLEQFPMRSGTSFTSEKESFNSMFGKVEDLLSQCIDHLAEFPAEHLDPLFSQQETNMGLMALLFSGNDNIYQATVELFKNIAQYPGRIEALTHVIDAFFSVTLYSFCWVFKRIAQFMPFSPIPRLLRSGKDIMDLLCDKDGLLRTKEADKRERESLQSYWQYSWLVLTAIFKRMEKWSTEVGDKPLMTEVCRNTMQYAQDLFGHYYLFVKVLEQNSRHESMTEIPQRLLSTDVRSSSGSPSKALDSMVKWLRLRDPYLAETLVNLIIDMLRRLKEYGTELPHDGYALTFMEEVALGTGAKGKGTKTILSDNQKAAMIRALEQYTGKNIAKQLKAQLKKQQRLDSFVDPTIKHETKVKPEVIAIDDDDLTQDLQDDLREAEKLRKQALLEERKAQKLQQKKSSIPSIPTKPVGQSLAEQLKSKGQSATAKAFIEQRKAAEAAKLAKQKELVARLKGKTGSEHTANAGSGLAGLGIEGKDHSTPRSELMVSSESESESEEDDELFGTGKFKPTVAGPSRLARGVPVPTKKIKQVRTAKDMRARLSPDLTGLHKTILAWDFFAETETPPNSGKDDYTLVSNTFRNVEEYQKTFEPLLVLEGWQSFRTAREDGNFKPFEVRVANSMIVDNFFEVNSVIPMNEGRDLGLGPSDVVLLSKGSRPHVEPNEPHCLARVKEITRKRGEMQIVYRLNSANNPMRSHLHDKATAWAVQLLSLTPLEREYGALMALPYYDLSEEIIRAKPSPLLEYSNDKVKGIQDLHNLNVAQAKAVKSAVDNDAFTLIQGPPGSGKTKTITAILSAILTGMSQSNVFGSSRSMGNAGLPPSNKKILIAAPSNAAVDELVMRFKDGIKVPGGATQKISVVRLGRSEAINSAVKDVTLEELVNARLGEKMGSGNNNSKQDIQSVMMEHKKASEDMVELRHKMDATRQKGEQVPAADDQLHESLRRTKTALSAKIDKLREEQNSASRDADINRRRMQQEILDSAHVLCATLSGSGHDLFQGLNVEFETVIIDEAAQSIELSALIPLKYGCSKCILVGDPKQLPPTVLSRQASKYQYEQSLFARMENNHSKDVHLLDTQYRMHPEISAFPSKTFYDSRLRDGGDMARLRARPWHNSQILAPYRFFDVEGMSQSAPKGRSLVNDAEIAVALAMYDRLVSDVPKYNFKNKIGIITPYKGQLKALKQRFSARYGEGILNAIDFNTTDAFQGRESEIIIFSCVRASTQGIGFLNDVRRMNVGLTRAKCSLWVLGNSKALIQGQFWRALVDDAKDRQLYTQDNLLKLLDRPLLTEAMMKDDIEMSGMDEGQGDIAMDGVQNTAATVNDPEAPSRDGTATPTSEAPSKPSRQPSVTSSVGTGGTTPRNDNNNAKLNGGYVKKDLPTAASSARSTPGLSRPDTPSRQSANHSAVQSGSGSGKPPVSTSVSNNNILTRQSAAKDSGTDKGSYGPSGGRNGLNAKVNCDICGSDKHFSHHCDNEKAREASLGLCERCRKAGHTKFSCTASRCLTCGEVGHVEQACQADANRKLDATERALVEKEEAHHQEMRQRNKEKRAQKQLGEHGASIPLVKTGDDAATKRKRGPEDEKGVSSKVVRTANGTSNGPAVGANAPNPRPGFGPSGAKPTGTAPVIIKKKRDEGSMFAKKR